VLKFLVYCTGRNIHSVAITDQAAKFVLSFVYKHLSICFNDTAGSIMVVFDHCLATRSHTKMFRESEKSNHGITISVAGFSKAFSLRTITSLSHITVCSLLEIEG
jgi:hypothetical protein